MDWIKNTDGLPDVKEADSFGEYYESELLLVAYEHNKKIHYELVKFTKGRDSEDEDYWHSWYCPAAEDIVQNVLAWRTLEPYIKC